MSLRAGTSHVLHHGMRAYYVPLAAGLMLVISAFLPWALLGELQLGGVPDLAGLWILGLGLLAVLLASLSIITRKNSRHPLLLVGLAAFGILFLSERLMERVAEDRVWVATQASAIVAGQGAHDAQLPSARMAAGAYVGLFSAAVIVLFGLTIVIRRASRPYAEPTDDDA